LKPANIKVRDDGTVKVLDFGLAKALVGGAAGTGPSAAALTNSPTLSSPALMTGVGVILGTAAYMSPEHARGKVVDRRADIWAFGCILYEMLSGRRAFPQGETVSDTLARVLEREPDWQALPAATPPKIRTLLERCLRKDARRRLHDMADARIEIEEIDNEPVSTFAPAIALAAAVPPRRREYVLGALLAVFLLVTAALAVRTFFTSSPAAPAVRCEVLPPEGATFFLPTAPQLSPDGRKLAFVATSGNDRLIWVRPIDSSTAQSLPGTNDSGAIFWSADSQYIGFFSGTQLKKVAVTGGPPQVLCNLPGGGNSGAWNQDGVILVGSVPGGGGNALLRVSAAGASRHPRQN
jgi:hypothetical protein